MTQEWQPRSSTSGIGDSSLASHEEDQQSGMQEKVSEYGSKAQEKVSEYGSKLQDQAETGKDKAAEGLEQAAEQMRSRVEDQGGMQAQVGTKVADSLERSASYLREHEVDQIWDDVQQIVKDHPIQAAAAAAVCGFLFARMLK